MAREIPFARSFRQLLLKRYGASVYGHLKSVLETVVPVQQVGHQDFSDLERPCWGIATYQALHTNRYSTSSITSSADIAIEGIGIEADQPPTGIQPGIRQPDYLPVLALTPPSTWVPWANTPAPGPVAWFPGIRPQIDFDPGRTVAITGNVIAAPPFWGLEMICNSSQHYNSTFSIPRYFPNQTWYAFNPPLILPTPLFLTVTSSHDDCNLSVSWRYREIG